MHFKLQFMKQNVNYRYTEVTELTSYYYMALLTLGATNQ